MLQTSQRSQSGGNDAQPLGNDAQKLGIDAQKLGIDAQKLGIDAQKLGIDAQKLGIDARKLGIDAQKLGIDAQKLGIDTQKLGNDARKLGNDARELGNDAQPEGKKSMHRISFLLATVLTFRCAAPAPPPPEPVPEPVRAEPEPSTPAVVEERVIGTVRVTASALNVRAEASTDAEIVKQVKKGEALSLLRENESWLKVRLASGETGWVASRFVSRGGTAATARKAPGRPKGGCPPDSDYAFTETPALAFSDRGAHGLVVVEAQVNAKGTVTSTKVVSNTTGDESLAFLAQREIKGAKFSPPIRNCAPRAFVFTYRRAY